MLLLSFFPLFSMGSDILPFHAHSHLPYTSTSAGDASNTLDWSNHSSTKKYTISSGSKGDRHLLKWWWALYKICIILFFLFRTCLFLVVLFFFFHLLCVCTLASTPHYIGWFLIGSALSVWSMLYYDWLLRLGKVGSNKRSWLNLAPTHHINLQRVPLIPLLSYHITPPVFLLFLLHFLFSLLATTKPCQRYIS